VRCRSSRSGRRVTSLFSRMMNMKMKVSSSRESRCGPSARRALRPVCPCSTFTCMNYKTCATFCTFVFVFRELLRIWTNCQIFDFPGSGVGHCCLHVGADHNLNLHGHTTSHNELLLLRSLMWTNNSDLYKCLMLSCIEGKLLSVC